MKAFELDIHLKIDVVTSKQICIHLETPLDIPLKIDAVTSIQLEQHAAK